MTLCLGWKRDQDVYLVADSVVTARGGVMTRPVSSFNESSLRLPGGTIVEERVNKVVPLDGHHVATVTGDADAAEMFLMHLVPHLRMPLIVDAIVGSLAATREPHHKPFVVLLACARPAEPTALLRIDSVAPSPVTQENWALEGSASEGLRSVVAEFFNTYASRVSAADFHAGLLAYLQYIGQKARLLSLGIGGTFHGARLSGDGIHWPPSTMYVKLETDFDVLPVVTAPGRVPTESEWFGELPEPDGIWATGRLAAEGVLAVASSLHPDVHLRPPFTWTRGAIERRGAAWLHNHREQLAALAEGSADHIVLFGRRNRIVVVDNGATRGECVQIKAIGSKWQLWLRADVARVLDGDLPLPAHAVLGSGIVMCWFAGPIKDRIGAVHP